MYKRQGLPSELAEQLKDFEKVKDRIAYKLINAEDNAVLLSGVPHFRYLDLAVVFYIIVAESEEGQDVYKRQILYHYSVTFLINQEPKY